MKRVHNDFKEQRMKEAKITIILDLMYVTALCVLYGMNTPSNRKKAEVLQVEEIGSAK
tara:strand:- start:319 stop:492 length:174 start_codon:yes stop_codon:yes gene_type:complete